MGECLKKQLQGRRGKVLNEAVAEEVERNVRRKEEIGSTAGELAASDVPIPPDSDPRKRQAMKAATVAARSSSQMEGNCAVADESRMEVEEEERDELSSSAVPNTRRRITTTTPLEESKIDEISMAVTTQESSDGIREKAMRIASLDEWGGKQQCSKMVQFKGGPRMTGTRKSMRW